MGPPDEDHSPPPETAKKNLQSVEVRMYLHTLHIYIYIQIHISSHLSIRLKS